MKISKASERKAAEDTAIQFYRGCGLRVSDSIKRAIKNSQSPKITARKLIREKYNVTRPDYSDIQEIKVALVKRDKTLDCTQKRLLRRMAENRMTANEFADLRAELLNMPNSLPREMRLNEAADEALA